MSSTSKYLPKRNGCSAPCATCPFLRVNFGKPNPEGYDPKKTAAEHGRQFFDWYSEKNLARLWNGGLKRGEGMLCHATDPTAHEYGGARVSPGNERICIGALTIVFRHVHFFEELLSKDPHIRPAEARRQYRAVAGKYPMPREGLFAWAWQFGIGRTDILGGLALPRSVRGEAVESCGVPWADHIVNTPSVAEPKEAADASASL
jgi:hypothetical protein